MTTRPDRDAVFLTPSGHPRKATNESWVSAVALRYVGDSIIYLADVIRDRPTQPIVVNVQSTPTTQEPT